MPGAGEGCEAEQGPVRGAGGHELRDEAAKRETADQWRVEAAREVAVVVEKFVDRRRHLGRDVVLELQPTNGKTFTSTSTPRRW